MTRTQSATQIATLVRQDEPEALRPRSRAKAVFSNILRAAGAVASVAVPGIGPAIGAITSAMNRNSAQAMAFDGDSDALRYIELQRAISQETRVFETTSNVMKARHDAMMNSIRNMKS